MVVPLLPSFPPVSARANAAGRVADAAGDFAADLEALLAATSGAAAGLAAMLGLASPAGGMAQALPPAGTMPRGATSAGAPLAGATPPGATPPGSTTQIPLPPGALPAGALPASVIPAGSIPPGSPIPTVPTPPSATAESADSTSGLPPGTNPGLQADRPAIAAAAEVIGDRAAPAGQEPWAPSPSPTGEGASPTSAPRPGAGEEPHPSSAASAAPGADRSTPVVVDGQPAIEPRSEVDVPPATVPLRHVEPSGTSLPPGPASVAAPIAQTSGHRAPEPSPVPDAAPLPAIPVRIAELTRRRTGVAEQIVVRLDPPELGTVRITVTARGDNVHVTLRADSPEARAALAAQRDSIETLLSGEGFDLSSFDVGYQRQGGGQSDTRRRGNGALFSAAFEPADAPAPTTAAADGALRL